MITLPISMKQAAEIQFDPFNDEIEFQFKDSIPLYGRGSDRASLAEEHGVQVRACDFERYMLGELPH